MFEGTVPGVAIPAIVRDLSLARVSGSLTCSSESFRKKIWFWRGQVVSATSSLIDDRLGEVIYRAGKLSLEVFIDAAGRVTPKLKFGDLLIQAGFFTANDLWEALNLQSKSILESLCYYPSLNVHFDTNVVLQKNETYIQFSVQKIMTEAVDNAHHLRLFESLARNSPRLELNEGYEVLVGNDFYRDIVALVQKVPDFVQIVDNESRLNPLYTTLALYEFLSRGILRDSIGFIGATTVESIRHLLRETVDAMNFVFAEVQNAAEVENVTDWSAIIDRANDDLSVRLGIGRFVDAKFGFLYDQILMACVTQKVAQNCAVRNGYVSWADGAMRYMEDSLYSAVLFILFELYNRNWSSAEFYHAKAMVDKIRNPSDQ